MPFEYSGREVRTVPDGDGEAEFVASDVAAILGYRDAANLTRNLDEDEKGTQIVSTPGGDQELSVITESGLYHAIFVSRKPEAQAFRRWVTSEVLPSIRRTGRYELPAEGVTIPALLSLAESAPRPIRKAAHELALALSEEQPSDADDHTDPAVSLRLPSGVDLPVSVWSRNGQWIEVTCDDPPGASALAAHLVRRTAMIGSDLDVSIRHAHVVRFRHTHPA